MATEGFSHRLDFLMGITRTSNSALARELSFDASYVSRIRNGKRNAPHGQSFVDSACAYFAQRIWEPHQMRAVEQKLGLARIWPKSHAEGAKLLSAWLNDGEVPPLDRVYPGDYPIATPPTGQLNVGRIRYGMGTAGMRTMAHTFLSELIATGTPHTLLFYSDESQDWLTEDPDFAREWEAQIMQLLRTGSFIRIVHTVTRSADEMREATRVWLPLYLTGRVQSWHLPNTRDKVFRRSLFVAAGEVSIASHSIGSSRDSLCALTYEADIVAMHEREISELIDLSAPLTKVARLDDETSIAAMLEPFAHAQEPVSLIAHPSQDEKTLRLIARLLPDDTASALALRHSTLLPPGTSVFLSNNTICVIVHLDKPAIMISTEENHLATAVRQLYLA